MNHVIFNIDFLISWSQATKKSHTNALGNMIIIIIMDHHGDVGADVAVVLVVVVVKMFSGEC